MMQASKRLGSYESFWRARRGDHNLQILNRAVAENGVEITWRGEERFRKEDETAKKNREVFSVVTQSSFVGGELRCRQSR